MSTSQTCKHPAPAVCLKCNYSAELSNPSEPTEPTEPTGACQSDPQEPTDPQDQNRAAPSALEEFRRCRSGLNHMPICHGGHHTVERCPIDESESGGSDVTRHYTISPERTDRAPKPVPHTKRVARGNLCYHIGAMYCLLREIAISRGIGLTEVSTDHDTVMVRLAILVSDLNAHYGFPELIIEDTSESNPYRFDYNGIRAHCSRILEFFRLPQNNNYCDRCRASDLSLDAKHTIEQLTRMS